MREILFKAKRLDNGEWVEGYYWTNLFNNHFIRIAQDKSGRFTIVDFEIDPDTLCQFTGMTDKDSDKIWENDIIEMQACPKGKHRTVVYFKEGKFAVDGTNYCLKDFTIKVKVIGNKFDNFNLLEV